MDRNNRHPERAADGPNAIGVGIMLVFSALFLGLPYGITRAVGRTLVGVYEVSTCYAPQKPIFDLIEGEVL